MSFVLEQYISSHWLPRLNRVSQKFIARVQPADGNSSSAMRGKLEENAPGRRTPLMNTPARTHRRRKDEWRRRSPLSARNMQPIYKLWPAARRLTTQDEDKSSGYNFYEALFTCAHMNSYTFTSSQRISNNLLTCF